MRFFPPDASCADIALAARSVPFLDVSVDGEFVRRTTPIPDRDVTLARTVFARPFQLQTFGDALDKVSDAFAQVGVCARARACMCVCAFV